MLYLMKNLFIPQTFLTLLIYLIQLNVIQSHIFLQLQNLKTREVDSVFFPRDTEFVSSQLCFLKNIILDPKKIEQNNQTKQQQQQSCYMGFQTKQKLKLVANLLGEKSLHTVIIITFGSFEVEDELEIRLNQRFYFIFELIALDRCLPKAKQFSFKLEVEMKLI